MKQAIGNKRSGKVVIMNGNNPDFNLTANDYAKHRQGFPVEFFERLKAKGITGPQLIALDIGTGTGTVARGLASICKTVKACDPAPLLLEKARELSNAENLQISFNLGSAEHTGMSNKEFDLVVVGQAWHWFDSNLAINEIKRVLKKGGRLVIAHFDWLPLRDSVPALSEELVLKHNPLWKGDQGTGFYPEWAMQLAEAGFKNIESWTFDQAVPYSKAAWLGRIRASAGVSASLSPTEVESFDREHSDALTRYCKEDLLEIPHRCFTLVADVPS